MPHRNLTGFNSLFIGMRITIGQFFKPTVTVQYPHETLKMPARFRGHIELVRDPETGKPKCFVCKLCERACPSDCITVEGVKLEGARRKTVTSYRLDFTKCSLCGSCVEACRDGAIRFSREYNLASTSKEEFVMDLFKRLEAERRAAGDVPGQRRPARRAIEAGPSQRRSRLPQPSPAQPAATQPQKPGTPPWRPNDSVSRLQPHHQCDLRSVPADHGRGRLYRRVQLAMIRSVCGLAICCIGLAGLYYFLHSPFLALMEILIYVGAVCVTIVFAVMLAEPDEPARTEKSGSTVFWGGLAMVVAAAVFCGLDLAGPAWALDRARQTCSTTARWPRSAGRLLTTYSLAFELISLALLVAILGALAIARTGRTRP